MGNSLGSVVCLAAATGDWTSSDNCFLSKMTKGIGMFNCGIGMNTRNVAKEFDGIQAVLITAVFDILDAILFGNIPVLTFVLDKVVTKELLRNDLTGLYQYATEERVDDVLVDSFYYPAKDPGSPKVLSQIYTNNAGATPMEIYRSHFLQKQIPIHLVWGEQDGVTPLVGPVGKFFKDLAADPETKVSMDVITGGHIPFDEVPECNDLMLQWLNDNNSE